jgi:hypothetical protein
VPRYSPLPAVSIDPRNEAEIAQVAAQVVYEASNQTLNDFSSGNPLAALIQGQAFAQGEFLFWANQLPDAILVEWLGPFLGAMRRLGTSSVAQLVVTISPSNTDTTIPSGSIFSTGGINTDGNAISFVNTEAYVIPAGQSTVKINVASQYVGSQYNCPANSINIAPSIGIPGLTVTNPQPAVGGSDVETYAQVQERFFTLIRRKNPVSQEDWQDFFIDFYGEGTLTSVQPNRPNQGTYNYLTDYIRPNGQVSFFVLGPDGVELTQVQLERGQNAVNYSVPVENQGHLYPFTLSQVQYNISLEIDANSTYGVNLKDTSLNFRDRLFSVLTPGTVFPATTDPTVSDVDAAFYSTFEATERFVNPHIEVSAAYNTPPLLTPSAATYTQVYTFEPTGEILKANDLVEVTLPIPVYYPVTQDFTPYSIAKKDQTVYGNLALQQIVPLLAGVYLRGQVVYWDPAIGGDGQLHVILENLTVESELVATINNLISKGQISAAMTYSPWVVGTNYIATTGTAYTPQIVQYDYASNEFIPDPTSPVVVNKRPGTFVWVVAQNFTLLPDTNDITGAQAASVLGAPVTPQILVPGTSYAAGTWVYTPQVGSGPDPVADPYYNYVDITKGIVNKYAYVIEAFTYEPNQQTISVYFDGLAEQGIIKEILVQNGDNGLPIAKYNPRFEAGQYLLYRESAGATPEYYIAATHFTPTSVNAGVMVNQGLIFPLYINASQYTQLTAELASSTTTVQTPVRMFTFFKGDRTFFRQGSTVLSYTATTNVTPLFEFYIYQANGTFILTEQGQPVEFATANYIPYFNPSYKNYAEDTILAEDGRNIYRVMRAFTPNATATNWTNTTVANTARIEEYEGNLLRYVREYTCEQDILSQLGRDISAIKLGVAQITLIPKDKGRFTNTRQNSVFVWENTSSALVTPQLSWYSGTSYAYNPPQYGEGTLNL